MTETEVRTHCRMHLWLVYEAQGYAKQDALVQATMHANALPVRDLIPTTNNAIKFLQAESDKQQAASEQARRQM